MVDLDGTHTATVGYAILIISKPGHMHATWSTCAPSDTVACGGEVERHGVVRAGQRQVQHGEVPIAGCSTPIQLGRKSSSCIGIAPAMAANTTITFVPTREAIFSVVPPSA